MGIFLFEIVPALSHSHKTVCIASLSHRGMVYNGLLEQSSIQTAWEALTSEKRFSGISPSLPVYKRPKPLLKP